MRFRPEKWQACGYAASAPLLDAVNRLYLSNKSGTAEGLGRRLSITCSTNGSSVVSDDDDPRRCRDMPRVHMAGADMTETLEHLERRDLILQLDIAAIEINLAQRLLSPRRFLGKRAIVGVSTRQESG